MAVEKRRAENSALVWRETRSMFMTMAGESSLAMVGKQAHDDVIGQRL